jgi:hypothetical protein
LGSGLFPREEEKKGPALLPALLSDESFPYFSRGILME